MSVLDADSGELVPDNATQPFPSPGETSLDLAAEATGRIAIQYAKANRLIATVSALAAIGQRFEDCLSSMPSLYDPAVAGGVNLDVVGELVGQSRVLSDGTLLSDSDLRIYIAQRILRNSSIASSPQYVAALTLIFGTQPFRYYDLGGMAVGIEVGTGTAPSADVIALLTDGPVPRAMGVGVGREWYDPADYFAFNGDPGSGAKGFGLTSDPTKGGKFAMSF